MRCKKCKDKFTPIYLNQKFCMDNNECIAAFAASVKEQNEKKKKSKWKKRKREIKESLKSKQDYEKDLEAVFNKFIRIRDSDEPCISCGATAGSYTLTAGHYFPAGSYKNIRFDEDNVHSQCWWNCNKNKSGNLTEYKIGLIKKIGQQRFDELEKKRLIKSHLTIPEIKELIIYYKDKVKNKMERC